MEDRLRVTEGNTVSYPVGASLELVKRRGGYSNLTDEEREGLDIKDVRGGQYCDDMPEEARPSFIRRGLVEVVEAAKPRKAKPRKKTKAGGGA